MSAASRSSGTSGTSGSSGSEAGEDNPEGVQVLVMAKAPLAGRAKTRLSPPLSSSQAANLAEAALWDTLNAVSAAFPARRLLALSGPLGPWCRPDYEVIPQRGTGLAERMGAAAADAWGGSSLPILILGMDTPQVTPTDLRAAMRALCDGVDAVLGPADDGGYWCIGAREARDGLFDGVPMSTPSTGRHQLHRLRSLGIDCAVLTGLQDVDVFEDALKVAALAPFTRFSRTLREMLSTGMALQGAPSADRVQA